MLSLCLLLAILSLNSLIRSASPALSSAPPSRPRPLSLPFNPYLLPPIALLSSFIRPLAPLQLNIPSLPDTSSQPSPPFTPPSPSTHRSLRSQRLPCYTHHSSRTLIPDQYIPWLPLQQFTILINLSFRLSRERGIAKPLWSTRRTVSPHFAPRQRAACAIPVLSRPPLIFFVSFRSSRTCIKREGKRNFNRPIRSLT